MSMEPIEDELYYERMRQEMEQRLFDPLPEGLVESDWLTLPEVDRDWLELPAIDRDWLNLPDIDRDWLEAPRDTLEQGEPDLNQSIASVDRSFDLSDR